MIRSVSRTKNEVKGNLLEDPDLKCILVGNSVALKMFCWQHFFQKRKTCLMPTELETYLRGHALIQKKTTETLFWDGTILTASSGQSEKRGLFGGVAAAVDSLSNSSSSASSMPDSSLLET